VTKDVGVPDQNASRAARRGLFNGYEAYRTPTADDYQRVLSNGLVVVDTNVLLNLYRYTAQARQDYLDVLNALRNNLWVPERVVHEFWKCRESVLHDPRSAEDTIKQLEELNTKARVQIIRWAKLASLPDNEVSNLIKMVRAGIDHVQQAIDAHEDDLYEEFAQDTNTDPVLRELERILDGRVGPPFSPEEFDELVEEGRRRVAVEIPPGFSDVKAKGVAGAYGDYLVWEQVLRQASSDKRDVLFVTGDSKPDWWRRAREKLRGPHRDLVKELRERAGVRLFMLSPDQLLKHAKSTLEVTVDEESAASVARVGRSLSDEDLLPDGGWTAETIQQLLRHLDVESPVRAKAIRVAAAKGGYISRDEIYDLAGYDKTRQLKGFTRPVKRIVQNFRDSGIIPEEAVDVLATEYDHTNFGWASGFTVPEQLIPLLVSSS
jgi:predicted nucleic acid-binding protein